MRIPSIVLTGRYPTGREDVRRSLERFNGLTPGGPHRDPMRNDARNLNAPARLQSDGTLLGIKQRVRSCRRWQLCGLQLDLRGALPLGMPLRFRDPRRNQVAPLGSSSIRAAARRAYRSDGASARKFKRRRRGILRGPENGRSVGGVAARGTASQDRENDGPRHRLRIRRCLSRCQSRSFSVSRLSCCFLPLARPIWHFARPLLQYSLSATAE